ncbi:hypothetical protein BH20ACT9_BH20ACT9_09290 [soil metagenome]
MSIRATGSHPRLQLLTVGELLEEARIDMPPPGSSVSFKRARVQQAAAEERALFGGE